MCSVKLQMHVSPRWGSPLFLKLSQPLRTATPKCATPAHVWGTPGLGSVMPRLASLFAVEGGMDGMDGVDKMDNKMGKAWATGRPSRGRLYLKTFRQQRERAFAGHSV